VTSLSATVWNVYGTDFGLLVLLEVLSIIQCH